MGQVSGRERAHPVEKLCAQEAGGCRPRLVSVGRAGAQATPAPPMEHLVSLPSLCRHHPSPTLRPHSSLQHLLPRSSLLTLPLWSRPVEPSHPLVP